MVEINPTECPRLLNQHREASKPSPLEIMTKATGLQLILPPFTGALPHGRASAYSPNMTERSLAIEGANSPRLTTVEGSKRGPGTATNWPGATCLTCAG